MEEAANEFVVHMNPVWRDRADFIIHGELSPADRPKRFEQLWARQLGEDQFEICCVPFFLYDVALGDVVRTTSRGERNHVVDRVLRASGRYVFRIWLGDSFIPRETVAEQLSDLGALIEWSSLNMLAVDAEDDLHARSLASSLNARQKRGELFFDTGRSV